MCEMLIIGKNQGRIQRGARGGWKPLPPCISWSPPKAFTPLPTFFGQDEVEEEEKQGGRRGKTPEGGRRRKNKPPQCSILGSATGKNIFCLMVLVPIFYWMNVYILNWLWILHRRDLHYCSIIAC